MRTKLPLSELFDEIGIETSILLLTEAQYTESQARRFLEEYPRLPKRKRDAIGAAQCVVDCELDTGTFRNLLIRLYSRHCSSLARLKQAAKIVDVTDTSLTFAANGKSDSSDERRAHLEKQGIIDSPKVGTQIDFSQTYNQQNNFGLPAFERTVIDLEERMRALNPATTEFIEAEVLQEEERVPA